MSEPTRYSGYVSPGHLDVIARGVSQLKGRSWELMQVEPGHRVLDVGCGPGTDTLALAEMVGPEGRVVGVDYDEQMVAEANARAEDADVKQWVNHVQADATALPFDDGYFDACRCERVLQHLPDPDAALAEMLRVTRRGGRLVVADPDQGTVSIDTPEVDIERRLMRLRAEKVFNNGFSGRRLHGQLSRAGLVDLEVELFHLLVTDYGMLRQVDVFDALERTAVETGVITKQELARWHASLQAAEDEGLFFGVALMVMVAGRKI